MAYLFTTSPLKTLKTNEGNHKVCSVRTHKNNRFIGVYYFSSVIFCFHAVALALRLFWRQYKRYTYISFFSLRQITRDPSPGFHSLYDDAVLVDMYIVKWPAYLLLIQSLCGFISTPPPHSRCVLIVVRWSHGIQWCSGLSGQSAVESRRYCWKYGRWQVIHPQPRILWRVGSVCNFTVTEYVYIGGLGRVLAGKGLFAVRHGR